MELLKKIGDYYIILKDFQSNDNSTSLSFVLHSLIKQYFFSLRISDKKFDFNYYKAEKDKSKDIPLVLKVFDSFFTNNEKYIFLEYVDNYNIMEYILRYNEEFNQNISHKLIHQFIRKLVHSLSEINEFNNYIIKDFFLDNLYLSKKNYCYDKNKFKGNLNDISNQSFADLNIDFEKKISNIDEGTDLIIRILLSFKKEFNKFLSISDFSSLKIVDPDKNSNNCNVWDLGIILFYLCNNENLFQKIPISVSDYQLKVENDLSSELIDFIQKLIRRESSDRISLKSLLMHPYINLNFDELTFPYKDEKRLNNDSWVNLDYRKYILINNNKCADVIEKNESNQKDLKENINLTERNELDIKGNDVNIEKKDSQDGLFGYFTDYLTDVKEEVLEIKELITIKQEKLIPPTPIESFNNNKVETTKIYEKTSFKEFVYEKPENYDQTSFSLKKDVDNDQNNMNTKFTFNPKTVKITKINIIENYYEEIYNLSKNKTISEKK